ncbi:MAG: hypothetical protein EPN60_14860 [Nevskiaceae bacterium]|nr:MAG: hypothetical protein EPO48_14495 [Nevskiaceae bacterium]TAM23647.1 MAG: hypothetical protein EPN60_14860 [Nevskiaceae bacterium]
MRIKIFSFIAASLLATGVWAQSSSSGNGSGSGSTGFTVGSIAVTSNTSATALSFTVPVQSGGSVTIGISSPASSLSQIGVTLGTENNGAGYYVITDGTTTITILVDETGEISSIGEGDTAPKG